jgi:NAD(P)-dependent dehydrogenase (short-subunit alcohol dehydrogenase family)
VARFTGKRAIITGGASGIGAATAQLLALEGARVVIGDIAPGQMQETVMAIQAEGGSADSVYANVGDRRGVRDLLDHGALTLGGLDIIVNVAGVQRAAPVAETREEDWEQQFDVNARAVYLTARHGVPYLRRAGAGVIVNVASVSAFRAFPGLGVYAASKAAVITLSRVMAVELAPDNIRVVCVAPGWTDTAFNNPVIGHRGGREQHEKLIAAEVPLGRQAAPAEIASVIAFAASDDASYLTGQVLTVDGGMTC